MAIIQPKTRRDWHGDALAISDERSGVYGDSERGHTLTAQVWHALLCEHYQIDLSPLPATMCQLMFAAAKINRAARPFAYNPDHYLDGINYLAYAGDSANPKGATDDNDDQRTRAAGPAAVREARW